MLMCRICQSPDVGVQSSTPPTVMPGGDVDVSDMPVSDVGVQSSTPPTVMPGADVDVSDMPVSDVGIQSSTPPTVMPGADVHVTVMPVLDVRVQSDMLLKETLVQGDDNPMPTKLFYGRKRAADGKGFDAAEHQSKCQLPMKRQRRRPIRFQ